MRTTLISGLVVSVVLALALIWLGHAPLQTSQSARPAPISTPTPTPTPTPTVTVIRNIQPHAVTLKVGVPPGLLQSQAHQYAAKATLVADVMTQLRHRKLGGRRAGVDPGFRLRPDDRDKPALAEARMAVKALKKQDQAVFGKASSMALWRGPGNGFKLVIFFFDRPHPART